MVRYYFLIASRDFLFDQEPIEEILRERLRHYKAINKVIDFAITTDLDFLDLPELKNIKRQLIKPSAAIISLNPKFINWLKLRIHYAIKGNFVVDKSNSYSDLFLVD